MIIPKIITENSNGSLIFSLDDYLFNQRCIYITEEITSFSVDQYIKQIMYLDSIDKEKEIKIFIDSPGGEVVSGLCLYDTIRRCKSPITSICIGVAASMGAILYLAADKRQMLSDSKLMIHDPSTNLGNSFVQVGDIKGCLENLTYLRERLAEIIAERTGKTIKQIYAITSKDTFFNAKDALNFGLATEILTEESPFDRNISKSNN